MKHTPEQKKTIKKAIKYAPWKEVFTWLGWSIFKPKKANDLAMYLISGWNWYSAFNKVKSE